MLEREGFGARTCLCGARLARQEDVDRLDFRSERTAREPPAVRRNGRHRVLALALGQGRSGALEELELFVEW